MITHIDIENIYGTAKAEFTPGQVTLIKGANGTGKSSLLAGLATPFEGGVKPERLRIGADKGHVLITLDDGSTIAFRAWIKQRKNGEREHAQSVEMITKDGITLPAAATQIRKLADALAVDPARLLSYDVTTAAGRKGLSQAILDVMPFEVSAEDLTTRKVIIDQHVQDGSARDQPGEAEALEKARQVLTEPTDLAGLRRARMALEETRRRIGVEQKRAQATIDELRGEVATEETPGATQSELEMAEAALEATRKLIRDETQAAKEEAAEAREALKKEYDARLAAIDRAEREYIESVKADDGPKETAQAITVAGLRDKLAAVHRAEGARARLDDLQARANAQMREYDHFSRAIEMLEDLKAAKLATSPIPGLQVDGDEITVDDVPWQAANTARLVEIVVQLCVLRAGSLRFLVIDDAEHLDEKTWTALKTALVDGGFQIVAAFVKSDTPLTIMTEAAVAA